MMGEARGQDETKGKKIHFFAFDGYVRVDDRLSTRIGSGGR